MLNGYKTYLAAIAALIVAIGAALTEYINSGQIDFTAIITAFIALALLFLRKGIKQESKET